MKKEKSITVNNQRFSIWSQNSLMGNFYFVVPGEEFADMNKGGKIHKSIEEAEAEAKIMSGG